MLKALTKAGIEHANIELSPTNGNRFFNAISKAKASIPSANRWMVDVHEQKEYANKSEYRCFMSKDGRIGYALHGRDVVSVYNVSGVKGGMATIMAHAVANGGRSLDCFEGTGKSNLPSMYAKFGAKAFGYIPFNHHFEPTGYNQARDGEPNVVAMILPKSLSALIKARNTKQEDFKMDTYKSYGEKNEDPAYDRLINARNDKLAEIIRNERSGGVANGARRAMGSKG